MARKQALNISNIDASNHPDDGGVLSPGPGRESFKLAAFWKSQVESIDQAYAKWTKRGNAVLKRFRDERNRVDEEGQRRMNLLWSNYKVMKPAIYSKCPTPVVDRKFLDRDPTGRLSSTMLERATKNELNNGFHRAVSRAVDDRLLPGRGVIWIRYEPQFGEGDSIPAPTINPLEDALHKIEEEVGREGETSEKEEKLEDTNEIVIAEKVITDYVDWKDFYVFPAKARTWTEVQAIGKKVHISKQEAKERFGDKIGGAMKPDTTPMGSTSERLVYSETAIFQDINERAIVVYEIWNKSDLKVYWVSPGYQYLADVKDDPLELEQFFPVPEPLFSTMTNDTLIPVPDFMEWQDQAIQIDELTSRIAMLTKACKIAGAYNSANVALGRILDESVENQLIPVDQWAAFAEKGGVKGAIDLLPLDEIQKCIETLTNVRQQAMIDLDQVTGLSDIVRGTSDSRETLGGIRLKNNNAGTRLSDSQEEVARFARDGIGIIAEIISKHFSDETLIQSSGILYEEELQPDNVLRELQASTDPVSSQMPGQQKESAPQAGPPQPQLPAPAPQQAPSPSPMPGQPDNNIVPFPGMQQPNMGMPSIPLTPPPPDPQVIIFQKIQKAISLLREDINRGYRIDIETDSTIFGDKVQEREDATEFITALGGTLKQFQGIAAEMPEVMPLLGRILQWGVRKYRTGRDLESEIDAFVVKMDKKSKQMIENPPPNPEQQKAEAEIEQIKLEGQIQQTNDQRESERQAQNDQRDYQLQAADDQRKMQMAKMEDDRKAQMSQLEQQHKEKQMAMDMEFKIKEHQLKMQQLEREATHASQAHTHKMAELKVTAEENEKKRAEAKRKASTTVKKKAS